MNARDFTLGFTAGGAAVACLTGYTTLAIMLSAVLGLMLLSIFAVSFTGSGRRDGARQ